MLIAQVKNNEIVDIKSVSTISEAMKNDGWQEVEMPDTTRPSGYIAEYSLSGDSVVCTFAEAPDNRMIEVENKSAVIIALVESDTIAQIRNVVLKDSVLTERMVSDGWKIVSFPNNETVPPAGFETEYIVTAGNPFAEFVQIADLRTRAEVEESLRMQFRQDIIWTDDAKAFYDKHKIAYPTSEDYHAWYSAVNAYWAESWSEREANKVSIDAATDEEVKQMVFSPEHINSIEDLKYPVKQF